MIAPSEVGFCQWVGGDDFGMGSLVNTCAPDDGAAVELRLGASVDGPGLVCDVFGDTVLDVYAWGIDLPVDAGTVIPVDLEGFVGSISRCGNFPGATCELAVEGRIVFEDNVGEGLLGSYSLLFSDGWIEGSFFAAFCDSGDIMCG
jgi:hypothetical protein